jgi:Ca2+-binding RTX toxin-like protein
MRTLWVLICAALVGALATSGTQGTLGASASICFGKRVTMSGDQSDNELIGTAGKDVISGRGGNDIIKGRAGGDLVCGGEGRDLLRGNRGRDALSGDQDADSLRGQRGRDHLIGGQGKNDVLNGGRQRDGCEGGEKYLCSTLLITGSRVRRGSGAEGCPGQGRRSRPPIRGFARPGRLHPK